jgi:hypothetical protein
MNGSLVRGPRRVPIAVEIGGDGGPVVEHQQLGGEHPRVPRTELGGQFLEQATIDGEDTLIAAYACSPLVTIPVSELKDGAQVRGKTIGDMGNGQPVSMVAYRDGDEDKLFVTNVGRGQDLGRDGFPGRRDAAQSGGVSSRPRALRAPEMRIRTSPEMPIRISPQAKVLPANTLRFYIHFPRSGEAHFDRENLWLLNEEEQMVPDPFLVLSQELWSVDGSRLTVLMEPGRIKRGLGADPSHEPAFVVGRTYSLVVTALGQTARHTFRVGDPVLGAVDETNWRIVSPTAGASIPPSSTSAGSWTPPFARTRSESWPLPERSFRRVCRPLRTEPQRGSSRVARGAPGSIASSSPSVSRTSVATGWARPLTMTWARVDDREPG